MEGVSSEADSLLLTYNWPGNVRELRNAIERAMILEDTASIQVASLHIAPRVAGSAFVSAAATDSDLLASGSMSLGNQERRLLVQALDKTGGNTLNNLACSEKGISPISSRNRVPLSAKFEQATFLRACVGECTFLVTKEFTIEQSLRNRRAVDRQERAGLP
jgi:transcriptional regulator with PAS, ATPase and Fis domain